MTTILKNNKVTLRIELKESEEKEWFAKYKDTLKLRKINQSIDNSVILIDLYSDTTDNTDTNDLNGNFIDESA